MSVQIEKRTYDDVLNAYHHYFHKWLDFITQCPELVNTHWFYEGGEVSDRMSLEMRRLVSVWMMLFGTEVVKVLIPCINYEIAKRCRTGIFMDDSEKIGQDRNPDMCVLCYMQILVQLANQLPDNYPFFVQQMQTLNIPSFNEALQRTQKK